MTNSDLTVRAARPADRPAWDTLWMGYLTFYKAVVPAEVTDMTWRRFFDPLEPMHAVVAEQDGLLVGFSHYLLHRSTWAPQCYCYLEDLFVAPEVRGSGAGRALIAAVEGAAREAGASRLYWLTHETNETAQKLYNKVAERPGFIQYRKKL